MASVILFTDPPSDIDYSLADGRVRRFELRGEKLYDEQDGTASDEWKTKLVEFVQERGLDIDRGLGLHAFVYRMQNDGLLNQPPFT